MPLTSTRTVLTSVFAIALPGLPVAAGQNKKSSEHWVATWGTAQQFAVPAARGRGPGAGRGPAPQQTDRRPPSPVGPIPAKFDDQTVRMIARAGIGGRRVRIELSNMIGAEPLELGAAHIAIHKGDGAIVTGTDRALTFSGRKSIIIPPGALAVSDPVDLTFAALTDLAVSLYLPHDTGAPTNHPLGLHKTYISHGDVTASTALPEPETIFSYVWLSGIDVVAPDNASAIVALGDSITDGYATTRDAEQAWPALLASRLASSKIPVSVINTGISGNQVLRDGTGASALARLDRDVLARPGVKWVILLEGINDINIRGRADGPAALTADELIWGFRQIIDRCHAHGISVLGATIMPEEGVPTASPRGEEIRQAANRWIRAKGNFDAIVDFDLVVQDPSHPAHIKDAFDPGDHIHPNDAGNRAMAGAFDLRVFKK